MYGCNVKARSNRSSEKTFIFMDLIGNEFYGSGYQDKSIVVLNENRSFVRINTKNGYREKKDKEGFSKWIENLF